jgi:hypothetical protein
MNKIVKIKKKKNIDDVNIDENLLLCRAQIFFDFIFGKKKDLYVKISRFSRRKFLFNISSIWKSNESNFFERKDEHKINCNLITSVIDKTVN